MERLGTIPIIQAAERTEGKISLLEFNVPGIDPDSLQINADRTLKVMHWGGSGT